MRDENTSRRKALQQFAWFAAASPLLAQDGAPPTIYPPTYSPEVMGPVNVHEIEEAARKKIHPFAYDYIAAGSAGEQTMRANRESFSHIQLRRRVGVDTSKIDTSLELFGKKLDFPILLGPGGAKNLVCPDGDRVTAQGAAHTKRFISPVPPTGWANCKPRARRRCGGRHRSGTRQKRRREAFARQSEEAGASAISISVDYPYTAPRDRNMRNKFDYAWAQTGIPKDISGKPSTPAMPGMIQRYTPSLTWDCIDWLHSATKLPVVLKGICTAEDARLAVERGAQAVIVSNHGGRTLDGLLPTLYALPEVVDAVNGRIPVLMDGGIRRGSDIVKALSLGAKAILIGRPYYWGLAAFGQVGVQRVIELLHAEMMVAMGMAGVPNLASFDRSLVEWAIGTGPVTG